MANLSTKERITWASHAVTVLGAAMWLGGMLTLGAIVAPVVFTIVPAPTSADAMTVVFRRFDVVAVTCAALMLACEIWRVRGAEKIARLDLARGVSLAIAGALALSGRSAFEVRSDKCAFEIGTRDPHHGVRMYV